MLLQKRHRRISSRTKRRCGEICNYVRELFNITEANEELNLANIPKLNEKIVGIENLIAEVNNQCQNLETIQDDIHHLVTLDEENHLKEQEKSKINRNIFNKTIDESVEAAITAQGNSNADCKRNNYLKQRTKIRSKSIGLNIDHERHMIPRIQSVYKNTACGPSNTSNDTNKFQTPIQIKNQTNRLKEKRKEAPVKIAEPSYSMGTTLHKNNHASITHMRRGRKNKISEVLQGDYIDELIRKQYRPMTMFDRSDYSEISAPICRDMESISEAASNVSGSKELNTEHRVKIFDMNQMNSSQTDYSDLYDHIPVKEKSSPNSRRKFVEENTNPCISYKEVPPCPFTHKPQFNLEAQCLPEELVVAKLPDFQYKIKDNKVDKSDTELNDTQDFLPEIQINKTYRNKTPINNNTDRALKEIKSMLQKGFHEAVQNAMHGAYNSDKEQTGTSKAHVNSLACTDLSRWHTMPPTYPYNPVIPIWTANGIKNGIMVPNPKLRVSPGYDGKDKQNERILKEIYRLVRTKKLRRRRHAKLASGVDAYELPKRKPRDARSTQSYEDMTSKILTDTSVRRSDTLLERLRSDETNSESDTVLKSSIQRTENSSLGKILKAIGIVKNKRTNVSTDETSVTKRIHPDYKTARTKSIRNKCKANLNIVNNEHAQNFQNANQIPLYLQEIEMRDKSTQTIRKTFISKLLRINLQKSDTFHTRQKNDFETLRESEKKQSWRSMFPINIINSFIRTIYSPN